MAHSRLEQHANPLRPHCRVTICRQLISSAVMLLKISQLYSTDVKGQFSYSEACNFRPVWVMFWFSRLGRKLFMANKIKKDFKKITNILTNTGCGICSFCCRSDYPAVASTQGLLDWMLFDLNTVFLQNDVPYFYLFACTLQLLNSHHYNSILSQLKLTNSLNN